MVGRIVGIVFRPGKEWDAIAREATTPGAVLRFMLPLCLVPALSITIGMIVFDAGWDPLHGYASVPASRVLTLGLGNFVFSAVAILLLALIFHWLAAPGGKPRPPFTAALKVAVYGAVPLQLAGAFLVIPIMVVLGLVAAMHSLFLCNLGLRRVLGVPPQDTAMLLAMCVVLLSVTLGVLGALASAFGLV